MYFRNAAEGSQPLLQIFTSYPTSAPALEISKEISNIQTSLYFLRTILCVVWLDFLQYPGLFPQQLLPRSLTMLAFNQIIKKQAIGKVVKDGVEYVLSVATEMSDWTRPEGVAEMIGKRADPIIQNSKTPLPPGAVEICVREPEHKNEASNDQRTHLTGITLFKNGDGTTLHFEKKENDKSK
ncbi:conserved hypothetical protein [Coccidioides posadasii str. Silveira]|uniref:Uncharacterized protein n=2 Tax=Coccidioides posadasii (strain RMSCC 757 / Silveira) TaxID=443226 RepID=E9DH62_COCPS|nr:conserved hypothetical protein [Coccidioides posadasii str. Silveira]